MAYGTSEDSADVDSTDRRNESLATSGLPRVNMNYEGFVYNQDSLREEDLARFDEIDLELVGSTHMSNTLTPGSDASLHIYCPEDGGTGEVSAIAMGRSIENEDGRTITTDDEWVRWAVYDGEPSSQ